MATATLKSEHPAIVAAARLMHAALREAGPDAVLSFAFDGEPGDDIQFSTKVNMTVDRIAQQLAYVADPVEVTARSILTVLNRAEPGATVTFEREAFIGKRTFGTDPVPTLAEIVSALRQRAPGTRRRRRLGVERAAA